MNRIFVGGLAVGMSLVVGMELVEEGLERSLGPAHVHVPHDDHGPFGMPDPLQWIASGSSSISANRATPRYPFR